MTQLLEFSIIVPTYNRPSALSRCVQSLAVLDFPRDAFEVIVVDDGGSADLTAVINPIANQINIRLARQANSGPAAARNHGANLANGRYLAFTDDDCRVDAGWLSALQAALEAAPQALVGGKVVNGLPHNRYSVASQLLIDYLYSYAQKRPSSGLRFFTSNNLAMKSGPFVAMDGFNETMPLAAGEDREFCDRWLSHGHEMVLASNALVYHDHHLTIKGFWRQHWNYGRGAFQFHRQRAKRGDGRIHIESFRFYWQLLRFPFGRAEAPARQALLLFIAQIANALGFFREKQFGSKTSQ